MVGLVASAVLVAAVLTALHLAVRRRSAPARAATTALVVAGAAAGAALARALHVGLVIAVVLEAAVAVTGRWVFLGGGSGSAGDRRGWTP